MRWYAARDLAGQPGMPGTPRNVKLRAERESWRHRNRRGRLEYAATSLPPQTLEALEGDQTKPDRETVWDQFARLTDKQKREAERRAAALRAVADLATQLPKRRSIEEIAKQYGVGAASLCRWEQKTAGYDSHDWPAVLARKPRQTPSRRAEIDPRAWQLFKADYLRLERPAASACYDRLTRIAQAEGFSVPSLKALQRRLKRDLPREAITLARDGVAALDRLYPAQRRDHGVFRALEAVNADGHKFDLFVKWPDGTVSRPVGVFWQDIYSGKLLSYRIDSTEHMGAVRLSFGDLLERYGIPSHAYLDNGRAFASKWITGGIPNRYRFKVKEEEPAGLLHTLDVRVHWTTPYRGQAKPIERAFRDLCEYVAKHPAFAGAYTGNRPDAKPENYRSRAVPIADFLAVLEQEVRAHNARTGRRSAVCKGRSFDEVFIASYATGPIRKATDEQRRLWLLAAESVRASRDEASVRLADNLYWAEELAPHAGESLIVRFDPDRLHDSVYVYDIEGRYLAEAPCVKAVGFADSDAAREHARAKKRKKRAVNELLEAERRMAASDVAASIPDLSDSELPTPEVIELAQAKRAPKPPKAKPHDPQALEEGARLIELHEQRKAEMASVEAQEERLWERYCELRDLDASQLTDDQREWMRSYESDPAIKGRIAFERDFGLRKEG